MFSDDRSAGVSPASRIPSKDPGEISVLQEEFRIRNRGYLPHFEQRGASYFITFRLADSLPKEILEKYKLEFEEALHSVADPPDDSSENGDAGETPALLLRDKYQQKIESVLDCGKGACFLKLPHIAGIVRNALLHFDKTRYSLYSWCIMPNHVHVLLRPFDGEKLQNIIHSWKSFTSKEANKLLHREGPFWQQEYYDRLVRSETEFQRIQEYILNNPITAGLQNWEWVGFGDDYAVMPDILNK